MESSVPAPPLELIDHAGCPERTVQDAEIAKVAPPGFREQFGSLIVFGDPQTTDLRMGKAQCDMVVGLLPDGWSWDGKRVLDFGCGYGRTLRHFIRAAPGAELWGCDIHRPSIEWLARHLSPPLHVFVNQEEPPLPHPSGSFDLIYAISVFTHLTDEWSSWLLELRRLLADDGLLIVTCLNRGLSFLLQTADWHEQWDEDQVGMHVFHAGTPWDEGGPVVFLSEWWIRAHWGRAFQIVDLVPTRGRYGQGYVVMRKTSDHVTPEDLEAPEADEPRELEAARYSLRQSMRESAARRAEIGDLQYRVELLEAERDQLAGAVVAKEEELAQARRNLGIFRTSRSWRLTHPLRVAGERWRRLDPRRERDG